MTPHKRLATLCQSAYDPVVMGDFDRVLSNGDVTCGITHAGTTTIVAFPGTESWLDGLHDIECEPIFHPVLGHIHAGMFCGVEKMVDQLQPFIRGDVIFTGHSLGCSHATFAAALLGGVRQLVLFAPPRCGYDDFTLKVRVDTPNITAYRNGIDPVPLMPTILPWRDVQEFTMIDAAPQSLSTLNPISWHMIARYIEGVPA